MSNAELDIQFEPAGQGYWRASRVPSATVDDFSGTIGAFAFVWYFGDVKTMAELIDDDEEDAVEVVYL